MPDHNTSLTITALSVAESLLVLLWLPWGRASPIVRFCAHNYFSFHFADFWVGFRQSTRDAIPGWDGLLFIYGVLAVPVVFALLVGLNLLVWARARINYVFIFELDLRTRLDHREYFQVSCDFTIEICVVSSSTPHTRPRVFYLPLFAIHSFFRLRKWGLQLSRQLFGL